MGVVAAAAAGKKGAGSFKLPAKEPKAKKPKAKKAKKPKAAKPKAAKKPAAKKAKKPAKGRQAKGCQEARRQEGKEASQEGGPQEEVNLRTASHRPSLFILLLIHKSSWTTLSDLKFKSQRRPTFIINY